MTGSSSAMRNQAPRNMTDAEWRSRVAAAAGYRLIDHYEMSDLVEGVVGVRVEDEPDAYLLQPYGMFFDEVRASDLVKVRFDEEADVGRGRPLNYASNNQVRFILQNMPEVNCVIHTHTIASSAVASLKGGLMPLNQHSFIVYDRVGYISFDFDINEECMMGMLEVLKSGKNILLLSNHGLLTVGSSVAEAFYFAQTLEFACKSQLAAMQSGDDITLPDEATARVLANDYVVNPNLEFDGSRQWDGFLRKLDRLMPGYDT